MNTKDDTPDQGDAPVGADETRLSAANRKPLPETHEGGSSLFASSSLESTPTVPSGGSGARGPYSNIEPRGAVIDRYRILHEIGEGGFGVVYLAEQAEPVRRQVALKIIKPGMDTRQVIARFEAERQALALMDHPHIAKVLDAGATAGGRPYFVMEFCPGESITRFADRHRLSLRARLSLVSQVCRAVQHAHQKGVIHRDLKPSNVLVRLQDGHPHATVIDFGISKATAAEMTEETLITRHGQFIGTPEYMSPEQASGTSDIDTRADVYSMGAMLYELLTGVTPFAASALRRVRVGEIQRIIVEADPPAPSMRLLQTPAILHSVAADRGAEPRRLPALIRGELDWVVMKCLAKDRAERYQSAADLDADITRYLHGDAVVAAPPSAAYRLRKFVARHRVSVGSAALIVVALAAGLAAALLGMRAAYRARDAEANANASAWRARQVAQENERTALEEAARSRATLEFVAEMFDAIDPVRAQGHDVTVAEILDPAAEKVAQAFVGQPEAEALVRGVLGRAYAQIARYPQANREFARARSLYDEFRPPDDPDAIGNLHNYGVALLQSGEVEPAKELLTRACEQRTARLGRLHRDTLASRSVLALARQTAGDLTGAIEEIRTVVAQQELALGPTDNDTLESLCSLADMLEIAGRLDDALATAHEASQRAVAAHGAGSSIALMAQSLEAGVLDAVGRYDEAAPLLRAVVEGKQRLYGEGHPDTLVSLDLLAGVLAQCGEPDQSLDIRRTTVDRAVQSLGERHNATLVYQNNLAQELRFAGRLDEAEPIYRHVLALRREISGGQDRDTLIVMSNLALLLMQRGAAADALPLLRDALDGFRGELPGDHWMLGVAELNLGRCETALGAFDQAESTLSDAHALLENALGAQHSRTHQARIALAELYEAWNRPDQAREWRTP